MDHDHHHDDEDNSDVVLAKGTSMLVLFCASMLCGTLPLLLARKLKLGGAGAAGDLKSSNRLVMILLSFGGGVLLSTTFMHLMPEIQENIEHLQSEGRLREFNFTLTPLLTCAGFFVMYLVEELVHTYIHYRESSGGKTSPLVRTLSVRKSIRNGDSSVTNSTADLIEPEKTKDIEGHHHHHSHMPAELGDDVTSALRGLLIVLALSIHELFEGLAVGLEASSANVWYMLGAVAAHKLVIAFCIGVELIAIRTKTWLAVIYITTFAVVSPCGIGMGLLLVGGDGATAAGIYSVILQGLASGTLLYVIFFEIWRNDRSGGLLQFLASVIGFGLMFGIQLLGGHSHSHSHNLEHGHSHDK